MHNPRPHFLETMRTLSSILFLFGESQRSELQPSRSVPRTTSKLFGRTLGRSWLWIPIARRRRLGGIGIDAASFTMQCGATASFPSQLFRKATGEQYLAWKTESLELMMSNAAWRADAGSSVLGAGGYRIVC
eukprot:550413-Pyramimonas_sp.AAC.1